MALTGNIKGPTGLVANYSVTALKSASTAPDLVFITDSGKEGLWKRDLTDTVSADNVGTIMVDNGGVRWKRHFSNNTNATWFGVLGNGVFNCTTSLQNAIDNGSGCLYIPDGIYMVDALIGLKLKNDFTLKLSENAVIKAIPNSSNVYNIVRITNKNNVKISGGFIQGEKLNHMGTVGEHGHGITVEGSTNITLENVKVSSCWGDGICVQYTEASGVKTKSENILIDNCTSLYNRRQGLSVVFVKNIDVKNSEFAYTSGVAPQSGIDLEPDYLETANENVNIFNCKIHDNAGFGIIAATFITKNVNIEQCKISKNAGSAIYTPAVSGYCNIMNCKIEGFLQNCYNAQITGCEINMEDIALNAGSGYALDFTQNLPVNFKDCTISVFGTKRLAIIQNSTVLKNVKVFDNCTFIQDGNTLSDTTFIASFNEYVHFINRCKFLHTGANPPTGYNIACTTDGEKIIFQMCFFDSILSYGSQLTGSVDLSKPYGPSSTRPNWSYQGIGRTYFDTTLNKIIVWNGSMWVL